MRKLRSTAATSIIRIGLGQSSFYFQPNAAFSTPLLSRRRSVGAFKMVPSPDSNSHLRIESISKTIRGVFRTPLVEDRQRHIRHPLRYIGQACSHLIDHQSTSLEPTKSQHLLSRERVQSRLAGKPSRRKPLYRHRRHDFLEQGAKALP
jgi:hypothetical protein